jgi:hypothetical protein
MYIKLITSIHHEIKLSNKVEIEKYLNKVWEKLNSAYFSLNVSIYTEVSRIVQILTNSSRYNLEASTVTMFVNY